MRVLFILIGLLFFSVANAGNLCETSFEKEVEPISKVMSERKDESRWSKYDSFLIKFSDCLDGGYAETVQGISETALAKDWNGFVSYVAKAKPSKKVMINIEAGFSEEMGLPENLKEIQKNAKKTCPAVIKNFCKTILKAKL